jgi:hypothetical protein
MPKREMAAETSVKVAARSCCTASVDGATQRLDAPIRLDAHSIGWSGHAPPRPPANDISYIGRMSRRPLSPFVLGVRT